MVAGGGHFFNENGLRWPTRGPDGVQPTGREERSRARSTTAETPKIFDPNETRRRAYKMFGIARRESPSTGSVSLTQRLVARQ